MPAKPPGWHRTAATHRRRRRALTWVTALAVPGLGLIAATSWLLASAETRTPPAARIALARTMLPAPAAWGSTATRLPAPSPVPALRSPDRGGSDLMLSTRARRSCPPAALACADLRDHLTWLQSRGHITYGPVRMEPGGPGDPTPRGVFHVAWKAGPHYVSTSFGIPIPYAVFFAPGGIAFHAGSLTTSSHGCVHLSLPSARYYHDHLPEGAEVAVF